MSKHMIKQVVKSEMSLNLLIKEGGAEEEAQESQTEKEAMHTT